MCFYFTHSFLNWGTFHLDGPLFATPSIVAFVNSRATKGESSHDLNFRLGFKQNINFEHCTEVRFVSFLSDAFITVIVVNPPENELAKRTSVY